MKYLYVLERHGEGVERWEVSRETKYNIWIKNNSDVDGYISETKISKKTRSTGLCLGSSCIFYYKNKKQYFEETPELLVQYKIIYFSKSLKIRRHINAMSIMFF